MTLSVADSNAIACKGDLPKHERDFIETVMKSLGTAAEEHIVAIAMDDRAARLEAAVIRYVIESRLSTMALGSWRHWKQP
jgi:hypothetical protein